MSRLLKVINDFPGGTNTLYAEELGINVRTVRRYIDQFKEWGLIRRNGTNRKGFWEIIQSSTDNQEIEGS